MIWRLAIACLLLGLAASAETRAVGLGLYAFDSEVSNRVPQAVAAGDFVTTVLTTDGKIFSAGLNPFDECIVPSLPPGRRFLQVASNYVSVAIVDDGSIRQWGRRDLGSWPPFVYPMPSPLPPLLPAGLSAVKVTTGREFSAALLSNGDILAWGYSNMFGELNVPSLPAGLVYVDVTIGDGHGYAKRSDGAWVSWGANNWGQRNGLTPPAGIGVAKIVVG